MNHHVWQILIIWIFHTDSALIFITTVLIMQGASEMHHKLFVCISNLFATALWLQQTALGPDQSGWWTTGVACSLWAALSGMKNGIITVIPLPWILSEGLKNTTGVHDILSLTAWLVCVKLDGKTRENPELFFSLSLSFSLGIKIYGCYFA